MCFRIFIILNTSDFHPDNYIFFLIFIMLLMSEAWVFQYLHDADAIEGRFVSLPTSTTTRPTTKVPMVEPLQRCPLATGLLLNDGSCNGMPHTDIMSVSLLCPYMEFLTNNLIGQGPGPFAQRGGNGFLRRFPRLIN